MRLSAKQRALALDLFGTDRLTRREFSQMIEEHKEASRNGYERANDADLLALAEMYTTMKGSGKTRTGPCPMAGCSARRDGFWVNTQTNTGGCHTCFWPKNNGSGSGPVGFIRALRDCEPWEARDELIGKINVAIPTRRRKPTNFTDSTSPSQDLTCVMEDATKALRASDGLGRWGRNYLTGRGLLRRTWEFFGIGVTTDYGHKPFIASPFIHAASGYLSGIRYSNAKICLRGSKFERALFGLPAKGHEIGFMVEGEINAMSIWQACQQLGVSADVISVGSQGAFKPLASDVARHLGRARLIVLWADKIEISKSAIRNFKRAGVIIKVLFSHKERDANHLLKCGQLVNLLRDVLCIDSDKCIRHFAAWCEPSGALDFLLTDAGWAMEGLHGSLATRGMELYKELEDAFMNNDSRTALKIHAKIKSLATQQAWELMGAAQRMENNALYL